MHNPTRLKNKKFTLPTPPHPHPPPPKSAQKGGDFSLPRSSSLVFSSHHHHHHQNCRKRKLSPEHRHSASRFNRLNPPKALSSSWSFVKRIFSSCKPISSPLHVPKASSIPSPSSSTRSLRLNQPIIVPFTPTETRVSSSPLITNRRESDISSDQHFFPLRNNIYPCPICGEIFQKSSILEEHQSSKHAVSELIDGDTGKNIVRIIFKTGWSEKGGDFSPAGDRGGEKSPPFCADFGMGGGGGGGWVG
ncbi:zinc finger (C2H2 type) family protein [Abeliophyllum distichum]|uniref:Zinc finger (C2H2 type) family protein n=1 Tax=Abeliophyllum distichum TaxID=126358 RepID=A0ABD1SD41_9LAMI